MGHRDPYDDPPTELTPEGLMAIVFYLGIPALVAKLVMRKEKSAGEVSYAFQAGCGAFLGLVWGTFAFMLLLLIGSLVNLIFSPLQPLSYPPAWIIRGWFLAWALVPTWMIWDANPQDRRVGRSLGRSRLWYWYRWW